MIVTEKTVSNLIESHFPFFIQDEGPLFVEFVKQYYKWAETEGGFVKEVRSIPEYKDIDATTNEFLVYFKEKYLKNIQFNTAASTKRMVKHSLDLYRSKGTPRAIDLLFKVVFDAPAEVYLPSRDIFKLSSGDFYEQYYLEVSPAPINITFVGKQIVGVQTGATAFVEKLVRKKVKGVYTEVFTISNLRENVHFLTGEKVKLASQISVKDNPRVIGSLTKVTVITGSRDFEVGDIVNINSELGLGAKGRVLDVDEVTGRVEFTLVDGGFGYSSNAAVYISEKVLRLANVQVNTAYSPDYYFIDYDTINAPQAKINVIGDDFNLGDNVYTYYTNTDIKGYGIVQGIVGNTTTSNLFVSVLSGNLECGGVDGVNAYYTEGNAVSANIDVGGYTDTSAQGTIIGTKPTITINYAQTNPFANGETVYQLSDEGLRTATGKVIDITYSTFTGTITVNDIDGLFDPQKTLYGTTSETEAIVTGINIDVGIVLSNLEVYESNTEFQFYSNVGNYVYSNSFTGNTYSNATITSISTGALASFEISNTFANPELIEINTDFVNGYLTTALSAADYELKLDLVTDVDTVLADALNFDEITIGTIKYLYNINNGVDYNIAPIIKIDEPLISSYNKKDVILRIANSTGGFFINELVRQPNTGALGQVKSSNSTIVSLRLLNFENSFSNTVANTDIVGVGSSSVATVQYVYEDPTTKPMGLNAVVEAEVVSLQGSVAALEVIDSGVGYKHNELGTFESEDGQRVGTTLMLLGTRTANTDTQGREGKSLGRYRNQNGFLSADKKIQDSFYYQEFSYEIRSSVTLDKYEAMLKQLLHVAGTKYFAATVRSSVLPVESTITTTYSKE